MRSRELRLANFDLGRLPGGTYHCWNCLMQGDVSVSGAIYPCCFFLGRDLASCLRIARRLSGYLHHQGRWASFLYRERLDALLDFYLARLFRQDHAFSLLGPINYCFHAASAQRILAIPSSISLAPPVASPYLNANEEIDLQAIGPLGC